MAGTISFLTVQPPLDGTQRPGVPRRAFLVSRDRPRASPYHPRGITVPYARFVMFEHKKTASRASSNVIALALAAVWAGACERADVANPSPSPTAAITAEPDARRPRLSFPQELRVDDASVVAFVERALLGVAGGEYEPYRLLWSMKEEPLSRGDYRRRWHGVTDIQLRALRRIILTHGDGQPAGDASYALLADFTFDPAETPAQREPLRGVVWVVVKEQDTWRLAKPPKAVKRWLREQVATSDEQTTSNTESSP